MKRVIFFILILVVTYSIPLFAEQSLFYKESNLIGGYSDKNNWIGKSDTLSNSLGFEYYRKFSNDYGDFLTADLQMRLAYDSLDSRDYAFGGQIHNAWLEYKLSTGNKILVGHFDPAFGLEPTLDTHSTILQTLAEKDIGFSKDWGVEYKGTASRFDYLIALQIGSGMSVYRRDDSYLATARIGSPQGNNLQYGLSLMMGQVLETIGMSTFPRNELISDRSVRTRRIGLDAQYLYGPYLLKTETAYGTNRDTDVLGYMAELDYTIPRHQNWEIELQYKSWLNDFHIHGSDDTTLSAGISYKLNQSTTLRGVFSHDLNLAGGMEDDKLLLQVYYFGR